MAIVGLFTQSRPQIGDLYFDAVLEESSELITEVTEFPIEDGSAGNDHAVQRPLTLTMRVGISDNAFRALRAEAGDGGGPLAGNAAGVGAGAVVGQLSGQSAALAGIGIGTASAAYQSGQASTRSESALTEIREIQRRKELVTVVASKRQYDNMLIASTRQETNKENEQSLDLVIELRELIVIGSNDESANVPAEGDTAETQAQPESDLGLVNPL